jgi:hypothetical protein
VILRLPYEKNHPTVGTRIEYSISLIAFLEQIFHNTDTMAETTVSQLERPQFQSSPEKPSFTKKIKHLARRVMHFVRRPVDVAARPGWAPQQRIHPEREIAEAEKTDPERAKKMSESGCAVRAIMSAAAHATDATSISATAEEWWARLNQMETPLPPDVHQELLKLYDDYKNGTYTNGKETALGKTLKQIYVQKLPEKQTKEDIRDLIKSKKQVMVIIDEDKGARRVPHILHLGLDNRGFISLSDEMIIGRRGRKGGTDGEKVKTRSRYQKVKLSGGTFTTFTVTPKA